MVQDHLATALQVEMTNNDPSLSDFLPKTSPNVRNLLLYQVATEVRTDRDIYNCVPEFTNNDNDELNIL